jgi:hypothetical protein
MLLLLRGAGIFAWHVRIGEVNDAVRVGPLEDRTLSDDRVNGNAERDGQDEDEAGSAPARSEPAFADRLRGFAAGRHRTILTSPRATSIAIFHTLHSL